MENVLVIIDAHDISPAEEVASTLSEFRVFVFDPTLVDRVTNSKLGRPKLIDWANCADYAGLVDWAHEAAFEIERELDKEVRDLLPETSMAAWQHLNFYYLFIGYRWYSGLWAAVLSEFKNTTPYIFICDNPQNFYWPSFLPSMVLMQYLKTVKIKFHGFTYGQRPDETDVVPNLPVLSGDGEHFDILTHLPTCFYDHGYFNDELKASGKRIINIHPKYWSVPIDAAKTINLIRIGHEDAPISEDLRTKAEQFADAILDKLDSLIAPYIASPNYRERQVVHIANIYKAQLITFHLLQQYFGPRRLSKILLSDHDSGFHGPIISFAKNNNIPVLFVPHSKTSADVEYDYENIISLTHPIQGETVIDRNGRRVLAFSLNYPETFSAVTTFPDRLQKIGLLLNGFSLNGVHCTDYDIYMEGVRKIAQWAKQNDIELNIRCRPGHLLTDLLTEAIGLDRDSLLSAVVCPMHSFVQSNDLCLMYDAPTNADIDFLRMSVPILNPIPAPLARAESATANKAIIPRGNVDEILSILDSFIADTTNFHVFRMNQFIDYVNLFKNAYNLRRFL